MPTLFAYTLLAVRIAALTGQLGTASLPAVVAETVYVVPGSHLDIGFTAPPSEVRERRVRILDLALDAAEHDSAFTWFEEGGWAVEAWLDHHRDDPRRRARLRALVLSGRIGVGATLLSAHAAAFPNALELLTLHLDRVEHELGRRPVVAVLNDVPSAPEALVDALAAAGVRYLLMGPNMHFTSPLPVSLVRRPFYWESARGSRVLVFIDTDGFTSGFDRWGLPPDCARVFEPGRFPRELGDDSVLTLGVRAGIAGLPPGQAPSVVQHALDNWEPGCARRLPAAVRRWNARGDGVRLVLATPDRYFRQLEARSGERPPVLRGEWGGDWDVIRASEPVWSWRLRAATRAIDRPTSRDARLALATAMDHNVGLGPRWADNLPERAALQHAREMAALFRTAVQGVLGPAGLTALPRPLARPARQPWPDAWRALVGEHDGAARVRAGTGFVYPFVDDSVPIAAVRPDVEADERRLLVRVRLDRGALERRAGARYRAVIEIPLQVPVDSLMLVPESSPSAIAGRWLLGTPPKTVVAPDGVRILGPRLALRAHGPLLIAWTLARDRTDRDVTWLQALAVIHAVDGGVRGGRLRRSFASLYPGEPQVVDFELELERRLP